jgi:hypothetical protein
LGALALLALFLSLGPSATASAAAPPDVSFAQDTFRATEGDGFATITVYRNSLPVSRLEVWYDTADRSAVAGQDYGHAYGRLVFEVGVSEMTFPVEVFDDDNPERLEELSLVLGPAYNGSNAAAAGPPAVLLISDDDPAPVPSTLPLRDANAASRSSVTAQPNRQSQAGGAGGEGGPQPVTAQQATAVRRRVTTRQSPTTPFELRVQAGGDGAADGTGDLAVDPALAVLAGLLLAVVAGKVWFACRPAS